MSTITKIEIEIKNLDKIKVENIDKFTNQYIGKDGIIPSLYRVITLNEKGIESSDCLAKLKELRHRFNLILDDYKSKFE